MPLSQLRGPIAVIDFETTGFSPYRNDRVVEVAAVVIGRNGQIEREFVTLVNPARDIGPSSIHGVTSGDILHAPQFNEIAALLVDVLEGTVAIAAHNVRFDESFLKSEFSRIDYPLPEFPCLCTLRLAGGGKLTQCCKEYGIHWEGEAHHALGDARATARLLITLLADDPHEVQKLAQLSPIQWPTVPRTAKQPVTRDQSRHRQSEPSTFLQRLNGRIQDHDMATATDGAVMAYGALLGRVLEDRHVDDSEAEALIETATRWGLSNDQISLAHREYLNQLTIAAIADGVVTDAERRDLKLVCRLLGQEHRDLDEILREATAMVSQTLVPSASVPTADQSLSGKSVCFTGELQCHRDGQIISREFANVLAENAGLVATESVTKKLDILVLADPHSQSGKAKKARQYGIRIMHEPVFWKAIGVEVS